MNYKIGDKVTLAPTTPLIITNILADSAKIEVKSPYNEICFWTSPAHLTPTLRPESTSIPPHKSPQIGDIIVTKPTAHSIYAEPIGNRIGHIESGATIQDCYLIKWIYNISTRQTFENCKSTVYFNQFV